jgi:hypothetical protein
MSMEHGVWNISGRMIDHPKCNAQQLMRSPQRRLTCISSKCKIARFHFLQQEWFLKAIHMRGYSAFLLKLPS